MEDNYKQLSLLIDKITTRLSEVEKENSKLHTRIQELESSLSVLKSTQEKVVALKEWKDTTINILKKLYTKIDKEVNYIESKASSPNIDNKGQIK